MGAYVQLTELKIPRDGVVAESDNQGQDGRWCYVTYIGGYGRNKINFQDRDGSPL